MNVNWEENSSKQNNYLSRLIGLFGEEISEKWLANDNSAYSNFGRPTIYWIEEGKKKRATLDFLIEREGKIYIVEQKNFFAYNKGRLRTIDSSDDFRKAFASWNTTKNKATPAWKIFNSFEQHEYEIKIGKKEYRKLDGKVVFWSDLIEADKDYFLTLSEELNRTRYNDAIGLVQMINDLKRWKDTDYEALIENYIQWNKDLFDNLRP